MRRRVDRRTVSLSAAMIAMLLGGCLGAERDRTPEADAPSLFASRGTGPLDALTRRFGRLRERMRGRGYDDEIGATRIFMLEGEAVALPIDLRRGHCTTFASIAGGGVRELSLTVFDGEGIEVAADAAEGEGGLAHVCPQASDGAGHVPHHLVLRAEGGGGAAVVGAFETLPGQGEGFEGLFEGLLSPQVPFRDVEARLAERRAVLRERGLMPVGEPRLERVAEGEEVAMTAHLEPGRCYVATARAGVGLGDVDLALFDPAGAEVARDLGGDAEPDLALCPELAGRYRVRARAFEGAGALGVMVLGGPATVDPDAELAAAPLGPNEELQEPETLDRDPVAALSQVTSVLEGRGYGAPSFVVPDGGIAPGEVRSHALVLGPGCFVVTGAAGHPETDLDLYLMSGEERIDRDTGISPTARVRFCPTETTTARVVVKAYGPSSRYALATVRAPEVIRDVRALRLEEATAEIRARGFVTRQQTEHELAEGDPLRLPVDIRAGQCVALSAAGAEGVLDIDLFLRDGRATLLASSAGPEPFATVSRCATDVGERVFADVAVYRGGGSVTVERLTLTERP